MRNLLKRFRADQSGFAAEFALVVPLLLIFLLTTFEVGMYAWRINQAEKATQWGARFAAVTDPVATEIATASYVNQVINGTLVEQGDRIPPGALGKITCTNTACTCSTAPCPGTTFNSTAFTNIANRMRLVVPTLTNANVQVEYAGSGLGYAGDPNGPDLAPIITVRLTGMSYIPTVLSPFGTSVSLPDFAYSITAEDASGSASN